MRLSAVGVAALMTVTLVSCGGSESLPSRPLLAGTAGRYFFGVLSNPSGGPPQLWASDGSVDGTVLIREVDGDKTSVRKVVPGSDGNIYFHTLQQFWRSDGTRDGTQLVRNFGPLSIYLDEGVQDLSAGPPLFLQVSKTRDESQVWRSNGTAEGTRLLLDDRSDPATNLIQVNGQLYFFREGLEWTDGIASEAVTLVADCRIGNYGHPTLVVGKLMYLACGPTLWVTDGTAPGTRVVKDFFMPGIPAISQPAVASISAVGHDVIFLVATDWINHRGQGALTGLWKTNGTAAGTVRIATLDSGAAMSARSLLTSSAHRAFWLVETDVGSDQEELWTTDGTTGGTALVVRLNSVNARAGPILSLAVGERLFFFYNAQLWSSDGTASGTRPLGDLTPGDGTIDHLTDVGGRLFFLSRPRPIVTELWTSDGTSAGTVKLRSFDEPR
jgi:ELWxxDGT repeat protein